MSFSPVYQGNKMLIFGPWLSHTKAYVIKFGVQNNQNVFFEEKSAPDPS